MKIPQVLAVLVIWGVLLCCDGDKPTEVEPSALLAFEGVAVKDLNTGDLASVTISEEDTVCSGATVTVNQISLVELANKEGTYYMGFPLLISFRYGQACTLRVMSSDTIVVTATATIPDSFAILPISDDSLNPGGQEVNIEWTPSGGADGYIVSIKGPPQAIDYAELVEHNFTGSPIEPRAFRSEDDELVAGDYQVYVIAYNTSFAPFYGISFPLPSGLPADTSLGIRRSFGAGVIAKSRMISVVEGP